MAVCRLAYHLEDSLIPQVRAAALLFLGIVLSICPAAEGAETPRGEASRADALIDSLQRKYEATETLGADFEQENELRSLGQTTRSKGVIRLHKPGRVRVEYTEPERQLVVSNGSKLWVHTPKLNQVIESEMTAAPSTPFVFLAGKGDLRKSFEVKVEDFGVPPRQDGAWKAGQPHRLSLAPRQPQPGFQKMWLEVDPVTFHITGLEYTDPLENRSRMRFLNIKEGGEIPGTLFQFQVPQGAEVLRMPSPGAQGR